MARLGRSLPFPRPRRHAVTLPDPTLLGTAGNAVSGTTVVLTTTADAAVGETILVAAAIRGTGRTLTSITDSAGNNYTTDVTRSHSNASSTYNSISRSIVTNPLPAGGTITATFSGAANVFERGIAAVKVSAALAPDTTVAADNGASTAAPWSSGTLAAGATRLLFGSGHANIATANTPVGATELVDFQPGASSVLTVECQQITAAGTPAVAGTWGSAANWTAVAIVYGLTTAVDLTVTPGTPIVAWTATTPAVGLDVVSVPGTPNVAWAGSRPAVVVDKTVAPGTPAVAWTGSTPTLILSSDLTLTPGTPTVAWTGSTPTITGASTLTLTPGSATVAWTGSTPTLILDSVGDRTLVPGAAVVAWTGSTPVITVVPDTVIPPPVEETGAGGWVDTSEYEVRNLRLRPRPAVVAWTGSRPRVRVQLDLVPLRIKLPPRPVKPPEPVLDLTLKPSLSTVAYTGSRPAMTLLSYPPTAQLARDLAARERDVTRLKARIADLEQQHEEEIAVLAAF